MSRMMVRAAALGLLVLAAAAERGAAQGWIEPLRPGMGSVQKVRTHVRVTVRERVAHVEVEEWFRNDGPPFGEADYLFPLPSSASFQGYSLWQGDEELRGEMMDAAQARRIYEEIVRSKRDPALIELVGHGLVRARVFPIGHGETRRIMLRYTQVLGRAGDALEFRYAAGPRERRTDTPLTFSLTIEDGAAYGEPFSPTHTLRNRREDGRLRVQTERPSGDVAVFLPLANRPVGIALATHRASTSEDGYFMLTLSPAAVRERRVPRDITVVLDVSGSMSGGKLEQAKAAVRQLLGTLSGTDRIRLIRFHSSVSSWRGEWTTATPAAIREARQWVEDLRAEGGTNIAGALTEAFALRTPAERLGVVLFLTDGLPSAGERDPERIAQAAERQRGSARVFAFGVGYDVNTYLLDRLSAAARGTTQYVRPEDDIESAVSTLSAKIQHPVLTDLELEAGGATLSEIHPGELPDLFAGEELVVFGRYSPRAGGGGSVRVRGRRSGEAERYEAGVQFAQHTEANDYIPRLWASRKVAELTRELRLHGHDQELIDEIRTTALRYGVLSEYTSYLVQEPGMVVAQDGSVRGFAAGAAAPPSAAVGQAAVRNSTEERARRQAKSVTELESLTVTAADAAAGAGARTVSGRTFRERSGVWEDVLHKASVRTVEVKAYSAAYFAVLDALPELKPFAAALPQFTVAGPRVSVRVLTGRGVERLDAAELARLSADFRSDRKKTVR